tara:strand:+ start:226 stop:1218 length:993 start_codon:yes stop_codon:yes gene_type:complete
MNYLITGCFGFIGFNFVKQLLNENKDVYVYGVDSLQNKCSVKNEQISKTFDNFEFFNLDINKINDLEIQDIDCLINFAAESHVDNSIYNPELFIDSNVRGVSKLLKFGMQNKIKNFLHVSTDEVYGSIDKGYFDENSIFNPSSPYSASKASAELLINSYQKTYGYVVTIVRPANNYGIYQQPEKLIPFSIAKLEAGENLEIYGDGKNIRHWLSVDDTNKAILSILANGEKGEVYNIGSEFYLSNIELSKKLINIFNLKEDRISFVEDRPGHDFRYAANIDKLKNIGWRPDAIFDNELEKTVEWYLNNKQWWVDQYKNIMANKRDKRLGLV